MEKKKVSIYELSLEELVNLFDTRMESRFQNLLINLSKVDESKKDFLTRKETAEFFGVSLPTIHAWVNDGLLNSYKMGTKTYFKRSELVDTLTNNERRVA